MIKKIQENLKKVLKDIKNNLNEEQRNDENLNSQINIHYNSNPYENASWGAAENWFCIRCGHHLKEIKENDPYWGHVSFAAMRKNKTQWYQCSNDQCFHYSAPLILHHPISGYESPPGDSYSISWVK